MTLTLEIPEDLAPSLEAMPESQRHNFALAAMRNELLDRAEEEAEDYQLTPDDIEALKQGAADIDAGRVSDGPTNMARRFEKLKQRVAETQERAA